MIDIVDIPLSRKSQLYKVYDHLDFEMLINNPWIFDLTFPTDDDSTVVSIDVLFNSLELEN